jgi:hypothetical protein
MQITIHFMGITIHVTKFLYSQFDQNSDKPKPRLDSVIFLIPNMSQMW